MGAYGDDGRCIQRTSRNVYGHTIQRASPVLHGDYSAKAVDQFRSCHVLHVAVAVAVAVAVTVTVTVTVAVTVTVTVTVAVASVRILQDRDHT